MDAGINVFPKDLKRPEYSLDMVKNMAKGLNLMIFAQVNSTTDHQKGARPLFASGVNLRFFLHCQCFQFVVARSQRSV